MISYLMAGQNIKTNYATTHPDATDVSTPEQRHEARRQLNRDIRDKQKGKAAPSIRSTTSEIFSGSNIKATGKAAVKYGIGALGSGISNVGKRVGSIVTAPSPDMFVGGRTGWPGGQSIPPQFLSGPSVTVIERPKRRKKSKSVQVVVSNRPEWIRF